MMIDESLNQSTELMNYKITLKITLSLLVSTLVFFLITASKPKTRTSALMDQCLSIQKLPCHQYHYQLRYNDSKRRLYHSMEPGQTYLRKSEGCVVLTSKGYVKFDTLSHKKNVSQISQLDQDDVMVRLSSDTALSQLTKNDFTAEIAEAGRYNPKVFLDWFTQTKEVSVVDNQNGFQYEYNGNHFKIQAFLDSKTGRVLKINFIAPLTFKGLFGDELTVFEYFDYKEAKGGFHYPSLVVVSRDNAALKDTVKIEGINTLPTFVEPLQKPAQYHYAKEPVEEELNLSVDSFSEHIKFITVENIGSRSIVVEFNDHVLVGEAPLSSRVGEAIIQKVKEIHPAKPIRYFVFSHYHNWYIGGIRAFVHKGAEIICYDSIANYIGNVINRNRSIDPDSLAMNRSKLKIKMRTGDLVLNDGQYEMRILHLGRLSMHTLDYSVYYFPEEKLVFDGDNLWFENNRPIAKASKRTVQFYDFLKSKNIEVKTLAHSWPVDTTYNLKKFVDFGEFEQSVRLAK